MWLLACLSFCHSTHLGRSFQIHRGLPTESNVRPWAFQANLHLDALIGQTIKAASEGMQGRIVYAYTDISYIMIYPYIYIIIYCV